MSYNSLIMDVARPYKAVVATADADLLVALSRTDKPRTGRELARLAERSQRGAQHALDRLVEQGIVNCEEIPGARLYMLNRDHLAAPVVERLAHLRLDLFERLRDEISNWTRPAVHASVFGSTARGDGSAHSDIDIFLVRPDALDLEDPEWSRQVDELAEAVSRWTGNRAGISQVSEKELSRLRRERPPVIGELLADSVHLTGAEARKLFSQGTQ